MKFKQLSTPVEIIKLVPGGQGIGELDGKKGFFWNALPGETVTKFLVTKSKSHYFEAIAEEIQNPSKHRIKPQDSCFLSTSPWQIMDYPYELEQKSQILKEIFRQAGLENDVSIKNPVQTDCQDFHYRNKMEYSLYWDNEKGCIRLAQHARGSHRKIPLETSSIERSEIWQKATEIVADLNARHEEARKYQSLLLRCDKSGKISGGLYENHKSHQKFDNLEDTILGHKYSYSPNGFFQINLPVYELALKEIAQYIDGANVLDLYSGVGTIGLSVARDKNLTLIENNPDAYQELENNCKKSGSTTVFAKSEEALDYIAPDQIVIVDPPRAGCDKKLIDKLLKIWPSRIIYLSCNPVTQARDVKFLSEKYRITNVTPYNFFPRTPHLENLIVLDKIA